jgi:hypothetical protein
LIYPFGRLVKDEALMESAMNRFGVNESSLNYTITIDSDNSVALKSKNANKNRVLAVGNHVARTVDLVMTPSRQDVLATIAMLLDAKCHVGIVGLPGIGKSRIIAHVASLLRMPIVVVPLFRDMASHELLQQRDTNLSGDTIWFVLCHQFILGAIRLLFKRPRMDSG